MPEIDGPLKRPFAALRLCVKQLSRHKGMQRREGAKAEVQRCFSVEKGHAETPRRKEQGFKPVYFQREKGQAEAIHH